MISRRGLLIGSLLAAPALTSARARADNREARPARVLAALERRHGGRLGVAVLDTGAGQSFAQRGDERFAMCSTFKFLAAAFVLARVDRGEESLDRRIIYAKEDLVPFSPITKRHVGGEGLSVGELCDAAVTLSTTRRGISCSTALAGRRA